jgi:Tol biopolymer transport system component
MHKIEFRVLVNTLLMVMLVSAALAAQDLRIVAPAGEGAVYAGASVRLVARWDGVAAQDVRFRWSSNIDGELGQGLETSTGALSYASHRISVEVLSGDSLIERAETIVHVITSPEQFTLSTRTDWEGEYAHSGRQLAYTSFRSGDPEVWVADVDSRFSERITFSGGRNPVWSPDGRGLVFWSDRSGSRDLWFVDLGQKPREAVRLTKYSSTDWMPAFHPLEQKVAYISKRDKELRLMVLELGAEDTVSVEVVGPERYPMFPRWSADGGNLLFTSFADSLPELILYTLENGAFVQIGPQGCEDADLSPDGSSVLLVRDGELQLLSLPGGELRPLTHESAGVLSPRFSSDGSRAVFATTRSGNYDLWMLDLPPRP